MQFTCNAATFADAFNTVAKVVGAKGGKTQSVRADLKEGVLTLTGTDMERTIVQEIDIEGGTDGVALLPKGTLESILRSLDSSDEVSLKEKDQKLTVTSGAARWQCNTENPAEFPEIEFPIDEESQYVVSSSQFGKLVERTVYAIDDTKKSSGPLSGVLVECVSGTLGMTGADGRRLSHQETSIDEVTSGDFEVIVSAETLKMVMGIIGDDAVSIGLDGENQIWFSVRNTRIGSRLMQGNYNKWRKFIPKCKESFGVIIKPFLKAIGQAAIMKNESSSAISFDFTENRVLIYGSQETGQSSIPCEVGWTGEDVSFRMIPEFVIDCIKPLGAETINIQLEPRGLAWVIETEDGFIGVLMPLGDRS